MSATIHVRINVLNEPTREDVKRIQEVVRDLRDSLPHLHPQVVITIEKELR